MDNKFNKKVRYIYILITTHLLELASKPKKYFKLKFNLVQELFNNYQSNKIMKLCLFDDQWIHSLKPSV